MSVYSQLARVKKLREQHAEMALLHDRSRRDAAENDYLGAQGELARHRREAAHAEREMYGDLCTRIVSRGDLLSVLENIAVWRNGERDKQETCERLQSVLAQASSDLAAARDALREASAVARKFDELDRHRARADAQAFEHSQEMIMDEIVCAHWGRVERIGGGQAGADWEPS